MSNLAVYVNNALVALHYAVHRSKAQTCSPPHLLCGKKRLKDTLHRLFIHAHSRVGHRHFHVPPRLDGKRLHVIPVEHDIAGFYVEVTSSRHRLPRVHIEVQKSLLDLALIHIDLIKVVLVSLVNGNLLLGANEHGRCVPEDLP